jgi:hypothetical protein
LPKNQGLNLNRVVASFCPDEMPIAANRHDMPRRYARMGRSSFEDLSLSGRTLLRLHEDGKEKSKVKALDPGIFKIGDAVKIRPKERASFGDLRSGTVLAVDDEYVYVRAGCDPGTVRKFPRDQATRFIYPASGKGKRD